MATKKKNIIINTAGAMGLRNLAFALLKYNSIKKENKNQQA